MPRQKKEEIPFDDFIAMVDPKMIPVVMELDASMRNGGCKVGIASAKSGYVVSYKHPASKRTLANFVFRKKGLVIRIYADNVMQYMEFLETLPPTMKAKIAKAPVCKRLMNPENCSDRCPKGYEFILEGEGYQKCRYNCFMFFLEEEANDYIKTMVEKELACRSA